MEHLLTHDYEAMLFHQRHIKELFPEPARSTHSILQLVSYKNGKPKMRVSGIVIQDNLIITASHVLNGIDYIMIANNLESCRLNTVWRHDFKDVALMLLPESLRGQIPPLLLARSAVGTRTRKAFVIGHPRINKSFPWPKGMPTVTIHQASVDFEGKYNIYLNVEKSIGDCSGVSGGAVINESMEVIGIPVKASKEPEISEDMNEYYEVQATSIDVVQSYLAI